MKYAILGDMEALMTCFISHVWYYYTFYNCLQDVHIVYIHANIF